MVVAEISSISGHGRALPDLFRQALGPNQMLGPIEVVISGDHSTAIRIEPAV